MWHRFTTTDRKLSFNSGRPVKAHRLSVETHRHFSDHTEYLVVELTTQKPL